MRVSHMMQSDGDVLIKSEWGPLDQNWPCVSFSKKSAEEMLRGLMPGRDILIFVGTSGRQTEKPEHRSRLLQAVTVDPYQVFETRQLVPAERHHLLTDEKGRPRWPHSLKFLRSADFTGPELPKAREIIPSGYRRLGSERRVGVVKLDGAERDAVMRLEVEERQITRYFGVMTPGAGGEVMVPSKEAALDRMAQGIAQRVAGSSGAESQTVNPVREAAPNIRTILEDKWNGCCALCGGRIGPEYGNPMLRASADRIDSRVPRYDRDNTQIVHRACNWAKNACTQEEFDAWLQMVRLG